MYRDTFGCSELSFYFSLCFWAQIKKQFCVKKRRIKLIMPTHLDESKFTWVSLCHFSPSPFFFGTSLSKVSSLEMDTFWHSHLRICLGRLFLFVLYVLLSLVMLRFPKPPHPMTINTCPPGSLWTLLGVLFLCLFFISCNL